MSYREIYDYMRFIIFRPSSEISEDYSIDENEKERYTVPKQVDPYVFYCSYCNVTSVGYEVLCPICGQRMKQPRYNLIKSNKNENNSCVLCHSNKCPECNLELNGENACIQDCPYCESIYHFHCWIKTIKEFGKCGSCLEKPPPEFEKLISLKQQKSLIQQKQPNEKELMAKFETETGKNAFWGNRFTKNYLKWKERNYP